MEAFRSIKPKGPIFDIGGGNGFVSVFLADKGFEVVLVEPGIDGILYAKQRGLENIVHSSLLDANFFTNSLPAVGLFDVLEHIEKDDELLRDIKKLLIPKGNIYITVPAYSFLWSEADDFAGHFRRYTLKRISNKVESAGFRIVYATYFFRPLILPIFLFRTLPAICGFRRRGHAHRMKEEHGKNGIGNRVLQVLLREEPKKISNLERMNFGSSCLLIASA